MQFVFGFLHLTFEGYMVKQQNHLAQEKVAVDIFLLKHFLTFSGRLILNSASLEYLRFCSF